jgi:hypothetical protein
MRVPIAQLEDNPRATLTRSNPSPPRPVPMEAETETICTADALSDYGLTSHNVQQHCPGAVEYATLDRRPCWRLADLTALLYEEGAAP